MTYTQLTDNAKKYSNFLHVEMFFPRGVRRIIEVIVLCALVGLAVYILGFNAREPYPAGIFFILLAIWLVCAAFEGYFSSLYYRGDLEEGVQTFELGEIILKTYIEDLTIGFLTSRTGLFIAKRSGLFEEDIEEFRMNRKKPLTGFASEFDPQTTTVESYLSQVVRQDQEFQTFLFSKGIQVGDFLAACEWVMRGMQYEKRHKRWWSKNFLASFEGIGVEWSYGKAYLLAKLSRPLVALHPTLTSVDFFATHTASLESILTRNRNANALIVGEPGVGKEDIIIGLQQHINAGVTDPVLRNQQIIKLDSLALSAQVGTKQEFETMLIDVLAQAEGTGNVILVVPLTELIRLGDEYNSDAVSLLDPYLMSNDLHIIGYADTDSYHRYIERNAKVMQRFERVLIKEGDEEIRIRILEDEALRVEKVQKVFFIYQAIEAVARASSRYFTGASEIEKSTDLLYEIATNARQSGNKIIRVGDVDAIVERLTGVPTGVAQGEEREKLLNLEDRLHEHVIGQNEAIDAISDALRRARSGLSDPRRPMGSFLFLGPTGVGKTETTKALAEVFFGDSHKVVRFDMSEYTGVDALERLIGARDGTTGELASRLRDTPYGVLHLDEFEKTNREVINLFLQILDEGMFTDADGEEVNVRNMIVVATSNAGSDLIYEYLKDGGMVTDYKDVVISTIIKRGTFSPELLNRFDGVILFHPLASEHLQKIAYLMLNSLNKRLDEKGFTLDITAEIVDFLVRKGSDPKFGARPLRRAVQDHIENAIAEKIMSGEAKPGSRITLHLSDLEQDIVKGDDHSFTFTDEE